MGHAEVGNSVGVEAFVRILTKGGEVTSEPLLDVPRSIHDPFQELLLSALTKVDEAASPPH